RAPEAREAVAVALQRPLHRGDDAVLVGLPDLDERVGDGSAMAVEQLAVETHRTGVGAVDQSFAALIGQGVAEERADRLAGGLGELRHQWSPSSGSVQVRFEPLSTISQR